MNKLSQDICIDHLCTLLLSIHEKKHTTYTKFYGSELLKSIFLWFTRLVVVPEYHPKDETDESPEMRKK